MIEHILNMIRDLVSDRDVTRAELIDYLGEIQSYCEETIEALSSEHDEDEHNLWQFEDVVIDGTLDEWEN